MSASFSFNFGGHDIESDADEDNDLTEHASTASSSDRALEPQMHALKDLLSSLPSRLSFSCIDFKTHDGRTITIPRRELFDIRAQIMAEDLSPGQEPIAGLSDDDITPNVYEGGFKTWECSVDLAKQLANSRSADRREPFGSGLHVIELGAGSALPSLVIFDHLLSREKIEEFPESKLVLSDYNLSVLRLSTIPNLLLTWCARQHLLHPGLKGDLDVSSDLCSRFLLDLQSNNIQIICISGAWTPEFVQLIPKQPADQLSPLETVVLASETIYSPATLPSFVDTLLDILRQSRASQQSAIGLVAAKRVYFGVGGGVDEFLRALEERDVGSTVVWESSETGVGRLILEVKI